MGIAASQARAIMLAARQSNLQYMGQQINQERSVLAQQCSALYNSLLAMTVPTPPSKSDFTTVTYSGSFGATSYSFGTNDVKPMGNNNGINEYIVAITQKATGDSLDKLSSLSTTTEGYFSNETTNPTGYMVEVTTPVSGTQYYTYNGDKYEKTTDMTASPLYEYTTTIPTTGNYYGVVNNPPTANGRELYEINTDIPDTTQAELNAYLAAIEHSGLCDSDGTPYDASDFYIYFTEDNALPRFVLKRDVIDGNAATTYGYISNGTYNKVEEYKNVRLQFDPSSGRILNMSIPEYDDNGNIISYSQVDLSAQATSDDVAYKDAEAKYEYAMLEYDKLQQEINAKTEIIQQQDKNLELKLQRFDTENKEITAEYEAIKKVLDDAIQNSYKTFSG